MTVVIHWTATIVAVSIIIMGGCADRAARKTETESHAPYALHPAQDTSTPQQTQIYIGTASTTAQFPDAFGTPHIAGYAIPVAIEVSTPLQAQFSGQIENNPFHFSVNPASAGAIGQEGLYTILSAGISFQGSPTSELMVQYWRFTLNGDQFAGDLIQPQNALSLTANLINLPQDLTGGLLVPFTFGLAQGTRITGTLTAEEIRFRVEGNTVDVAHPFVSDVVAMRVQ